MKWKIGDKLRIKDASKIYGDGIKTGHVYEVVHVNDDGTPEIDIGDIDGLALCFYEEEMPYVARVEDTVFTEDYEINTELGEPSAECNCAVLTEIAEELTDIKAMIGRLLRNGGGTE